MAADLLDKYGNSITNLSLIPSSGGVYEVMKNDQVIFSKKVLNRFPELEELINIIRKRKMSSVKESYTKKLLDNKKLSVEKVKEEIAELIDAIEKNSNKVHESADVLYHLMVLLEANGIKIEDVMDELKKRQK